jgi:hypothetical protein
MNGRKAIYALVLVAALVASSFIQGSLTRQRETLGLTRTAVISNAPPVLAFTTVALGGFRGLIANALWIRTTQLQEEGKYFEAVQLADWITTLQPHFNQVWLYQAWNMAYNISVKFPNPEDRWLWVQRGIELLRDQGLVYNPNQALMYRELAWLFQHKMGANLDDAHWLYKTEWAKAMEEVIPGGKPDYAELFKPTTPETKARAERLVTKYKLEPAMMKKVDDTYGPLEWRLPETHAIYWGMVGVENCSAQDKMPLRRTIFQPMLTAFHRGKIITNRFAKRIEVVPNLNMVTNASRAYEDSIRAEPEQADHIARAHRNFIKDAVYFLYTNNKTKEAEYWFRRVQQLYGFGPQVGLTNATLDEYALSRVQEDINETSRDRQTAILQGMLSQAFYNYAMGEEDQAQGLERMVQKIHANYASRTDYGKSVERVQLPAISELKRNVLLEMLRPDPEVSAEFQSALRARLGLPANFGVPDTNAVPSSSVQPAPRP